MEDLICLFGKWYRKEFFKYATYCTNKTLNKQCNDARKEYGRILVQFGKDGYDTFVVNKLDDSFKSKINNI